MKNALILRASNVVGDRVGVFVLLEDASVCFVSRIASIATVSPSSFLWMTRLSVRVSYRFDRSGGLEKFSRGYLSDLRGGAGRPEGPRREAPPRRFARSVALTGGSCRR